MVHAKKDELKTFEVGSREATLITEYTTLFWVKNMNSFKVTLCNFILQQTLKKKRITYSKHLMFSFKSTSSKKLAH